MEFKCSGTQASEQRIQVVKLSNSPAAAPALPCCKSKIILGCLSAAFAEWSLSHCSALLPGLRAATKANIKCRNLYPIPFRRIESFLEKIKCPWICPLQIRTKWLILPHQVLVLSLKIRSIYTSCKKIFYYIP